MNVADGILSLIFGVIDFFISSSWIGLIFYWIVLGVVVSFLELLYSKIVSVKRKALRWTGLLILLFTALFSCIVIVVTKVSSFFFGKTISVTSFGARVVTDLGNELKDSSQQAQIFSPPSLPPRNQHNEDAEISKGVSKIMDLQRKNQYDKAKKILYALVSKYGSGKVNQKLKQAMKGI